MCRAVCPTLCCTAGGPCGHVGRCNGELDLPKRGLGCDHYFFSQAEDGTRFVDVAVVHWWAFPIECAESRVIFVFFFCIFFFEEKLFLTRQFLGEKELGRASCRERVSIWGGAVSRKKTQNAKY